MPMRHIVVCELPRSAKFCHLSHNRHDLKKNGNEYKMRGFVSSTTFVWNISHSKKNLARYDKNVYWSLCNAPIILVRM